MGGMRQVAVPDDISDEDASQYLINPFTCVGLVDSLNVPQGEYILQTAAGTIFCSTRLKAW
jgi:trans-2-enoyl-CoA reductase